MEFSQIMVFLILGNNHLHNVKSLQSIYRQTYANIFLVVINDCCIGIQSERFFYNLNDKRRENIKKVIFVENRFPKGEEKTKEYYVEKFKPDYIITLHSGDCFYETTSLETCAYALERAPELAATVSSVNLIYENIPKNNHRTDINKIKEQLEQGTTEMQGELSECSVLYRADTLKDEALYCRKPNKTWHILKKALESSALYYNDSPICSSTVKHIQSLDSINIDNKSFEKTQKEIISEKTRSISGHTALYKLSRWSLIKKYILAAFILLFASFLGLSVLSLGGTAKLIICIVCTLAVLFVGATLAINLLFKWIAKAEIGI